MLQHIRLLDAAAEGGLYSILLNEQLPGLRNSHPFGHQNYLSGWLLLSLPVLFDSCKKEPIKSFRYLHLLVLLLGGLLLFTLQSRNTILGLLSGAGLVFLWYRGTKTLWLPYFLGGTILLFALLLLLSPRLLQLINVFSPQRLGMWNAAYLTGVEFFPWGCGEGLTPEMLHYFSEKLPYRWPASLQFHQTWLHFWAVGGVLALLGILGLSAWIGYTVLTSKHLGAEERRNLLPSVFALGATFSVMMSDYQWDIYPITLMVMYHVVALARKIQVEVFKSQIHTLYKFLLPATAVFCTLICLTVFPAALRSRALIDQAGRYAEQRKLNEAAAAFEEAYEIFPEAYSLNMAGQLLAQDPSGFEAAAEFFERSLNVWEAQPVAHDFLAEIYIRHSEESSRADEDDYNQLVSKALHHALRFSQIAPEIKGCHMRVASLHLDSDPDQANLAVERELRYHVDYIFPSMWQANQRVVSLEEPFFLWFLSKSYDLESKMERGLAYRQAWSSILGRPAKKDNQHFRELLLNINSRKNEGNGFKLLNEYCLAEGSVDKIDALRRLLIYLVRKPIAAEQAVSFEHFVWKNKISEDCTQQVLLSLTANSKASTFQSIGLLSRHPRSLRVIRLGAGFDTFAVNVF